jgi:hypothetical protein
MIELLYVRQLPKPQRRAGRAPQSRLVMPALRLSPTGAKLRLPIGAKAAPAWAISSRSDGGRPTRRIPTAVGLATDGMERSIRKRRLG